MIFFVFLFFLYKINAEKFCVNCVHFKKPFIGNKLFGKCAVFPRETDVDKKIDYLISVKKNVEFMYCSTSRQYEHLCGEKGKYYIRKCFLPDFLS
jgi:hypothetical protein